MRLIKSFATVGGATIASRILGFVREIMIAALIGAGPVADAFYAAFRFPNLFRRLFAEGAFNTAFIPLFAKELEAGGNERAESFAKEVFSVLLVVLLSLTTLAILVMPFLVDTVLAPGFGVGSEKSLLTVDLARTMFPYLLCMSLVAMLSGTLNAFRRYFVAAFVPVLLNIIMIAVLAYCILWQTGNTAHTGRIMAWAVFVAGFAQLFMLWISVRRTGFHIKLGWPKLTPPVKRLVVLAIPAAIAGGITQINLLVGQIIASSQESAITFLQLADRIYQLPLGVIGIAIGVVLLPELARDLKAGEDEKASRTQNQALEFAMFFTLPSAFALFIIPELITSVLYERGAFDKAATLGTSAALQAFALGLPAFVLIKVLSPAFFAREDTRSPMVYAGLNASVNIILSIMLFQIYGHVGIAIATSIAGWVNVLALVFGLMQRNLVPYEARVLKNCSLMLVASFFMAVLLYGALNIAGNYGFLNGVLRQILSLMIMIMLGISSYFLFCRLTGAVNFGQILRNLKRSKPQNGS